MQEMRGSSMEDMMVCVHNKRCRGAIRDVLLSDFATAGQDGFALVSFLAGFEGRI